MVLDLEDPNRGNVLLASVFMGLFASQIHLPMHINYSRKFQLGFGYFATYHTILETRRCGRYAIHVILCWGELLAYVVRHFVVFMIEGSIQ